MQVIWRNFRLTFEAATPEEHAALEAVWVAFGSQVDERQRVDDEDTLESRNVVQSLTALNFVNAGN